MPTRIPNAERSKRTRRAVLDAARELFAEDGYIHTSAVEIMRRAGVTEGALHYHFPHKLELFRTVYTEQNTAFVQFIAERIQAAEGDLWQRGVIAACHAFVARAADPSEWRILYLDGPAVLGRSTLQQIGPGLEMIRQTFAPMMAAGVVVPQPLVPLSHLLWALFFEAGRFIAHAADPVRAAAETRILLPRLLDGLRRR